LRVAVAVSVFLLTVAACADARAAERYFIEFRARNSSYIGHTYISYFRTSNDGRVIEEHETGLIP
jgi:hypothetical protein